jgi:hypothetical protein
MARVTYSHQIHGPALARLLNSRDGGVARDLLARGFRVETLAKRNLAGGASGPKRIDTGRLRSSVTTVLVWRNGQLAVLVGTNVRYARWVHDGTGRYGPRHRDIRPVRAKYLRFRGRRGIVYVKSVKGMKPNRFLLDALPAARH